MNVLKCGICSSKRSERNCEVVSLSEEERQALIFTGDKEPPKELVYCKPCWATLHDPVAGPNLMKGLMEVSLRRLGVVSAERIATRYHKSLVERIQDADGTGIPQGSKE